MMVSWRAVLLLSIVFPVFSQDTTDPIDIQKREEVEVELVLIDALVLDRQGRTVPGLTPDDFEIIVDQEIRPINTLDETCDGGALEDPRGVRNPAKRASIKAPSKGRKIVLAFDYLHLNPKNFDQLEALDSAIRMLANGIVPGEEIMVVVLNGGLRIEQGFTPDPDLVIDTLKRMKNDMSLWGGRFHQLTEKPFYYGLQVLIDVLGTIEGSKAIVLYSNNLALADHDDLAFMNLASSAASARSSVYPVRIKGLVGIPSPLEYGTGLKMTPLDSSPALARLANDTGGRFTRGTNDLSLGYARAQRDLGCRYTVGFYVNRLKKDNPRMIRLRVKGEGLEVRYPGHYKAQSPEKLKNSRLMSAFLQPEMFPSDFLRTHLFLLQPRSTKEWDALVAVNFPVQFNNPENPVYEGDFGVIVTSGPRGTHHFNRNVLIRPKEGAPLDECRFTFLEPLVVTPGTYTISTVVSETGQDGPSAVKIMVDVPEVPWQDLTLLPPILGRPRNRNIVVRGDGPESNRNRYSSEELAQFDILAAKGSFEPLLVLQTRETEELLSRNKACLVGAKKMNLPEETTVDRFLTQENGHPMELNPFPLVLDKGAKVRCRNLFENFKEAAAGEGQYIYKVIIDESKKFNEKQHRLPLAIKEEPKAD